MASQLNLFLWILFTVASLSAGTTNHTKDGSVVRKCRVADKSASVGFSLWNEQASAIEGGDILKLTKGYCSLWKGSMVLYSGKYGQLQKIGEFNMVFSETPDMSDSSQDFVQRGQQQPPPPPPPPPPQNPSGGRNMEPRGVSSSGNNGRMGTGPPSSGNWNGNNRNGNNHLSNGHQPQDAPHSSIAGHVTHEPGYQGYPQKTPLAHMNPQHSSHYRGPPQHQNHSHNGRYNPYHRPPLANHSPDPRSSWM